MSWSASLYTVYERERTRPVRDLVAAIEQDKVERAVDLGCGPGNSTEVLAQKFAGASILGIDSSADMIAAARTRLPACSFEVGDISSWTPQGMFDVILSNAVMQWVPDHETLLPKLVGLLTHGGSLAIQLPDNLADPSQTLMKKVADAGPWASRLADAGGARTEIGDPDYYYRLLKPICPRVDIWRTVYVHPLPSSAAIVDWFRGTGLLPYLAPLDTAERMAFLHFYEQMVEKTYSPQADGSVLLQMPRLFIVATR